MGGIGAIWGGSAPAAPGAPQPDGGAACGAGTASKGPGGGALGAGSPKTFGSSTCCSMKSASRLAASRGGMKSFRLPGAGAAAPVSQMLSNPPGACAAASRRGSSSTSAAPSIIARTR